MKSDTDLWDLFTKKEEYAPILLDQYKRFPYYLSKHRTIFNPLISEFLTQNGLKVEYPHEKQFAVCLTHDIDTLNVSNLRIIYDTLQTLRKAKLKKAIKILLSKIKRNYNPLWNFTQIMNLEEKYDAKSTFFFLSLKKRDLDYNYSINELTEALKNIVDRGWEVGLHGAHNAYINLEEIKKEKERMESIIKKKVIGYRNHYLKFKIPITWELLKKAEFKYDTTFGYPDCVGFRNGICHPFKPYNLNTNDYINIWEIPLTIMDSTLNDYMHLNVENAWEITKLLIDTVRKFEGVITLLWHNTYLIGENLKFYQKILEYCSEKNAWMTSGEEIRQWWEENDFVGRLSI